MILVKNDMCPIQVVYIRGNSNAYFSNYIYWILDFRKTMVSFFSQLKVLGFHLEICVCSISPLPLEVFSLNYHLSKRRGCAEPMTRLRRLKVRVWTENHDHSKLQELRSLQFTCCCYDRTRMKIPAWFPGGKGTYFCSILHLYPVWIFTNIQYKWNFIFSNRSKEFQAYSQTKYLN